MNVLSTGDYVGSISNNIAQVELLIGLKKQGIQLIIVGRFTPQVLNHFREEGIICIEDFPITKVDLKFANNIKDYVNKYNVDILHLFHGHALRNCLIAVKNIPVRVITYMGSTSLHWHDPSSYLTYLSPRVDKIICISDSIKTHVKKQLFGKNKKKPIRIKKGYNPEWFSDSKPYDYSELGIDKNNIIVCLAANYLKVKGIEYFIKSTYYMDKNTNVRFILLGDMRGNKNITTLIENSPIKDKIHALGFQNDVTAYFKSADIYVQTSNNEGLGRSIIEAMCSKKPIIMTDAGGCTELIDDSCGVIVPRKNPKEIANAIQNLAKDKNRLIRMGNNAYERILKHYSVESTIQETLALYKEEYKILKEKR